MRQFIANLFAAQRNAAEVARLNGEIVHIRARFRNIVLHATGGETGAIDGPLNDIAVEISRSRNQAYNAGMEEGVRRLAHNPLANMSGAELAVLDEMSEELGFKLATLATRTGLMDGDVRAIVRTFALRGLAQFGPLYDLGDGTLKGRGYTLTEAGYALQKTLPSRQPVAA